MKYSMIVLTFVLLLNSMCFANNFKLYEVTDSQKFDMNILNAFNMFEQYDISGYFDKGDIALSDEQNFFFINTEKRTYDGLKCFREVKLAVNDGRIQQEALKYLTTIDIPKNTPIRNNETIRNLFTSEKKEQYQEVEKQKTWTNQGYIPFGFDEGFYAIVASKPTGPSKLDVQYYIFSKYPEIYNKYCNDEFKWNDQQKIYKKILTDRANKLANNSVTTFNIKCKAVFGNYDFDKKGFPVTNELNQYLAIVEERNLAIFSDFPDREKVLIYFNNFDKFNFLSMDEETAHNLIELNKSTNGNISRELSLNIFLRSLSQPILNIQISSQKTDLAKLTLARS